ncbi:MAG: hypothetical protein ABI266_08135 [Ginsengibacter sp.]
MKKSTLILSLFLFAFSYGIAQNTYEQNLENLAVIHFPAQPLTRDTLGQKVYSLATDKANYIVLIMNDKSDTKIELKKNELDEFYTGTINGTLQASEGKLISKKDFTVDGLKGVEFEFTSDKNPNIPKLRFQRMIYTDKGVLAVNFWTNDDNKNILQRKDDFFNSLKFNTKDQELKQYTSTAISSDRRENSSAYNLGFSIGKILGFLLIPGIIILIIVLVRNKNKRNEKMVSDIGKN